MIKKIVGNSFRTRIVNSGPKWRLPHSPKYPQWFNKRCHYLDGLYSSLVHFRPKYCLEIGTHKGDNSTAIFQKYFDDHMPEGVLITLDIVPCQNLNYEAAKSLYNWLKSAEVAQLIIRYEINNNNVFYVE